MAQLDPVLHAFLMNIAGTKGDGAAAPRELLWFGISAKRPDDTLENAIQIPLYRPASELKSGHPHEPMLVRFATLQHLAETGHPMNIPPRLVLQRTLSFA